MAPSSYQKKCSDEGTYDSPAKNFLFCSNGHTGFAEEGEIVRPEVHSLDLGEDEEDIEEEEEDIEVEEDEEEDIDEEEEEMEEEEEVEDEEEEDEDLEDEEVILLHCCPAFCDS
jgi:hypothetical protein